MLSLFSDYMQKGGLVNGLIFAVCVVVVHIGIGKAWLYRSVARSRGKGWLRHAIVGDTGAVGRLGGAFYRNRLRETLLEIVPRLDRGLDTMAAWTGVAPLLGLLGTVVGMIRTFKIITEFGVGNPGLLSEGISVALLTTQAGLVVAFPCLLFHSILVDRRDALVKGIIADGESIIASLEREERDGR